MLTKTNVQACPFARDLIDGLSSMPKSLPCQWLYDQRGSELFEAITELPEYYPTRTETKILAAHADRIMSAIGPQAALIEYGAGASIKTRILLDAADRLATYVPIDVSAEFLIQTADDLRQTYRDFAIQPVVANFLADITLPALPEHASRTGFFPGSTIGNLSDVEIQHFLNSARQLLGASGHFILGYDLHKSADILIPAYDDAQGVTAAFNLNLLVRANRELGTDFDVTRFKHQAIWNEAFSRIEMHLVSQCRQSVRMNGQVFNFDVGETIHTENSRKFTQISIEQACLTSGWTVQETFNDPDNLFAVALLKAN